MKIVRWIGLTLMAFGLVTGGAMIYMRYIVKSTPEYKGPNLSAGTMGGYQEQDSVKTFTTNAIIAGLVFCAGFVAFCISGGSERRPRDDDDSAKRRRRKKRRIVKKDDNDPKLPPVSPL